MESPGALGGWRSRRPGQRCESRTCHASAAAAHGTEVRLSPTFQTSRRCFCLDGNAEQCCPCPTEEPRKGTVMSLRRKQMMQYDLPLWRVGTHTPTLSAFNFHMETMTARNYHMCDWGHAHLLPRGDTHVPSANRCISKRCPFLLFQSQRLCDVQ